MVGEREMRRRMFSGDSRTRTEGGLVGFGRKRTRTRTRRKRWTHAQAPSTPRRAEKWSAGLLERESGLQREIRGGGILEQTATPPRNQRVTIRYAASSRTRKPPDQREAS